MTAVVRIERYESLGCMDREDAEAMAVHMHAIADRLARSGGVLDVVGDHAMGLHYARLVRVAQRATQPNVVARAVSPGVERITYLVENGRRTMTIRTRQVDLVLDLDRRRVSVEQRDDKVVEIAPYLRRA